MAYLQVLVQTAQAEHCLLSQQFQTEVTNGVI